MAKPVLDIRSLKEQARGHEKAMKLRAAIARLRLKLAKLEHRAIRLREKIEEREEEAGLLERTVAPPPPSA